MAHGIDRVAAAVRLYVGVLGVANRLPVPPSLGDLNHITVAKQNFAKGTGTSDFMMARRI